MTERIGWRGGIGLVLGALGVVVFWPQRAYGHERPFVAGANSYPINFRLLASWPVVAAVLVSAAGVLVAREVEKRFGSSSWSWPKQLWRGSVPVVVMVSALAILAAEAVSTVAVLGARELENHFS